MPRCPGCSLDFSARHQHTYCCRHCMNGSSKHGQRCTVQLMCASCSICLERNEGKYINGEFYCCGHCEGAQRDPSSTRRRHSDRCIVATGRIISATGESEQQPPVFDALSGGARSRSRTRSRRDDLCIVCEERPSGVVCVPCGHYVLCYLCSQQVPRSCVMCRGVVTAFVVTYGR